METKIRLYNPSDLTALYDICLKTGDSGKDATEHYDDPKILGHFYAAPYAVLEPNLCFVVTCSGKPCGYILGTQNSEQFYETCENEWFPKLRENYPLPNANNTSKDAHIIRLIHKGHIVNQDLTDYPAHLHIDLLPITQGKGIGRKLMEIFLNKLRELEIPSVHLQVGKSNPGAIQYYEKMGFHIIKEYDKAIAFGMVFS
ncbi:MAG: N-acetyltransferase [Calditrichaeota bacterium]|nr:MAG: N-acetyltransferase [Calditrichota bacterium]MBL1205907.1 N-acetyltransferase [Calditrichota bacterium]NOG45735.1 GNAT family N-acetyltransferase [Calditrichota bacterium]